MSRWRPIRFRGTCCTGSRVVQQCAPAVAPLVTFGGTSCASDLCIISAFDFYCLSTLISKCVGAKPQLQPPCFLPEHCCGQPLCGVQLNPELPPSFRASHQIPEDDVSLRALAALTGALANNPLSRKLFVGGGHLLRLPALLTVLKPGDTSERPLIQPRHAAATSRRRWGWGGGGGRDKDRAHTRPANVGDNDGGDHGSTASPSSGGGSGSGGQAAGMEGGGGGGGWSGEVPVARICAALSLVSALVGCKGTGVATAAAGAVSGEKHGLAAAAAAVAASEDRATVAAADDVRAAVGREGGLLEAVCELALASPFAPAGGGPTWVEYGLPEDCQRSAMEVLTALVAGQPGNQVSDALIMWKIRVTGTVVRIWVVTRV